MADTTAEDLAADIREVDGNHDLGTAELAEALVAKGWTRGKTPDPNPPLKEYKVGEYVEVLRGGDWVAGRISSKQGGVLNVDTERGPVGVGGPLRIRKVS